MLSPYFNDKASLLGAFLFLIDLHTHPLAGPSVLSLSSQVEAALDNSNLVSLCVLLTHTRQKIINKSDRK